MKMVKRTKQRINRSYKRQIHRDVFSISQKDIVDLSLYIDPLKPNDALFVESNNPNDPKIALHATDNDMYFANGYICTSIFLLDIINYGKSYLQKDSYIYPAIFCFRMYLEITMKLIIQLLTNQENITLDHNLLEKWDTIRKHEPSLVNDEEVIAIDNIIKELSYIDPQGTAFRYPLKLNKKSGQENIKLNKIFIDVLTLRERFLQIYRFFEGLYDSVNTDKY